MAQSVKADLMCGRQALGDMATEHTTHFVDAAKMEQLENGSVNLVVTSPPYPMIQMWDEIFAKSNPEITKLLANDDGWGAFEEMHLVMDKVWAECHRVTSDGGFVCINIGDATRSIGGEFAMYTNRARIDVKMRALGFTPLPDILWRKQSNAPNKFMGSGMLPAGAYVTYEHEYIAIYRKGGKRQFKTKEEKQNRRESAFFWEERNVWFSDLWDLKGTKQKLGGKENRERSAAYPFELPFRLIAMLSVRGDTVLDPFMGTGSTHAAAIALQRNSVGYEIDPTFAETIEETKAAAVEWGRQRQQQRLDDHKAFVVAREASGKVVKHFNENHQIKVMTSQEVALVLTNLPAQQQKLPNNNLPNDRNEYFWPKIGKKGRKFKHEFILNGTNQSGSSYTGRNFVDSPPDLIREIKPGYYDEWVNGYFERAVEQKNNGQPVTRESLNILADRLQKRVKDKFGKMDLPVPQIPTYVYRAYIEDLVLRRTWDGIKGENFVQKWLDDELELPVRSPPSSVDAEFGVDLIIIIKENVWIGVQVKPQDSGFAPMSYVVSNTHQNQHKKFEKKYVGKVFWAQYTIEEGAFENPELLEAIRKEINRLK